MPPPAGIATTLGRHCGRRWGRVGRRGLARLERPAARDPRRAAIPAAGDRLRQRGPEFINHELARFCDQEHLTFTRSRSGNKNDGCQVEQKIVAGSIPQQVAPIRRACELMEDRYQLIEV